MRCNILHYCVSITLVQIEIFRFRFSGVEKNLNILHFQWEILMFQQSKSLRIRGHLCCWTFPPRSVLFTAKSHRLFHLSVFSAVLFLSPGSTKSVSLLCCLCWGEQRGVRLRRLFGSLPVARPASDTWQQTSRQRKNPGVPRRLLGARRRLLNLTILVTMSQFTGRRGFFLFCSARRLDPCFKLISLQSLSLRQWRRAASSRAAAGPLASLLPEGVGGGSTETQEPDVTTAGHIGGWITPVDQATALLSSGCVLRSF